MSRIRILWATAYTLLACTVLGFAGSMDHHWPTQLALLPGLLALPLGPPVALLAAAVLFEVARFGAPWLGFAVGAGVLEPPLAQALLATAVVFATGIAGYLQWFVWLPRLWRRVRRRRAS